MDFTDSEILGPMIIGGCTILATIIGVVLSKRKKDKIEPLLTPSPSTPEPAIQSPFSSPLPRISPDGGFIGRKDELKELIEKIQSGCRIFDIWGMGGLGKTQLVFELAETLKSQFPVQIYLDLKGVPEEDKKGATEDNQTPLKPEKALANIIHFFNPEENLSDDVDELHSNFLSVLEDKKVILLMDNARNDEQIKRLIPPNDSILLVTSRKNIHLQHIHSLPLKTLPEDDSIDLLLGITERIDAHAKTIAELCGYLPLALNVAGKAIAEHHDLAPEEFIEELNKGKGLEPVDRSIAASCKWLDEDQQKYFYKLSVFPGSFDSRAAGAIWKLDESQAKKTLSNLVNISLVKWDEETKRYHLHDLTRVFAGKKIEEEHYDTQKLHAEHYLKILEEATALYMEGRENVLAGLQLFDLELENIETGQAWSAQHYETDETATRLCNEYPDTGSLIFSFRQQPLETIQWRKTALVASRKLKLREFESVHLGTLGMGFRFLGDYHAAIFYHKQALKISQEIGDKSGESMDLGSLGTTYDHLGENQKAIDHHEQALKISREIGYKRCEGAALGGLGVIYWKLGDNQKAFDYFEQQLGIVRKIGDKRSEGKTLYNKSLTLNKRGNRAEAMKLAEEATKILEMIGDPGVENARKQLEEWKKEA